MVMAMAIFMDGKSPQIAAATYMPATPHDRGWLPRQAALARGD